MCIERPWLAQRERFDPKTFSDWDKAIAEKQTRDKQEQAIRLERGNQLKKCNCAPTAERSDRDFPSYSYIERRESLPASCLVSALLLCFCYVFLNSLCFGYPVRTRQWLVNSV